MIELARLAIVVITRNEERHIADSLGALMLSLRGFPGTRTIVVDSCSTDKTVKIASTFPVEIYRYQGPPFSAAAGRRVGFFYARARNVLFVDGDCCIEPGWLERGLAALESSPSVGVVYGSRREVFENALEADVLAAPNAQEYGLGGNGLYKSDVMELAGGFNPYLPAEEEAELLARIKAQGFEDLAIPDIMFAHHRPTESTLRGYFSRVRRGLARGLGQTLRLASSQGLFTYHARRINRYLFALGYLVIGVISVLASLIFCKPVILAAWGAAGIAAFSLLWLRRRSLRSTLYILADWVTVAFFLPADFLRTPKRPNDFQPIVERLR